MGIIEKQTFKGSFFSYLGVAIGFITVGILWPRYLESEEIGVINFLLAISAILAHIGSLGINGVTNRLFPYFRDKKSHHHGFLLLGLLFLAAGIIIILCYYFLFRGRIISNNSEKSFLVARYAYFIVPFTIATLLYNFFDNLYKMIYNAVIGIFLKEFIFRLLNFILILLFAWYTFRFSLFLNIYFIIYAIPALVLIISISRTRQFNLHADFDHVKKDMRRSIAGVSLFGLMGGMGTLIISNIDKIMINRLIDLEATGIYSIAFLFGAIITMPSRSLSKIATTIIAESWKSDDTETISKIYSKSCLNQYIFAGLVFLMVWLNIDLIFHIIPPEYEAGKYVILFMSLSGLVEMATGLNGMILSTSKYYRYQSTFIFLLLFLLILTNFIFIPRLGITGAAIASLLSTIIYNTVRAGFLYLKFKMQPFNFKFLIITALLLLSCLVGSYLQAIDHWILRTAVITLSILVIYLAPILLSHVSEDINSSLSDRYVQIIKWIKKQ